GFYDDYLKVTKQSHAGFSGSTRLLAEFAIAGTACYLIAIVGHAPRPPQCIIAFPFHKELLTDAGCTLSTSLAFPFLKDLLVDFGWFFVAFAAFVVVGAGNAVNLTDGLDGLATVPVMIAAGCFGAISWAVGNAVFAEYLQVHFVPGAGELAVLC